MHWKAVCVAALWALTCPALAAAPIKPAQPAASVAPTPETGPLPVKAFFADPAIGGAQLSPSGKYLAFVRQDGDDSAILIYDIQSQDTQVILTNAIKDAHFGWIRWKGESRLVVGLTYLRIDREGGKPDGEIEGFVYRKVMVAIDRDGKNLTPLFTNQPTLGYGQVRLNELLDQLRGDPDHILAVAQASSGSSAVWRVDVHTGKTEQVEVGDDNTYAWDTDRNGAVIARYEERGRDIVILGRAPKETNWQEVVRIRPKDFKALSDFELLGPAPGPGQLYVAVKPETTAEGAARTVRIYDFRSHALGPPVWPALDYDIAGIVSPPDSSDLDGVCYWVDTYRCDFKDREMQANFRGLEKFFNGDESLTPVSYSDDNRWWVFEVSGPSDPGSYYLYDWQKKTMLNLGAIFPGLPSERLGTMQRFSYKARDGLQIPAYVTRPPGAPSGALPLVVLPHGGPEERDNYDFDIWSQFIATRGYLVLQPNYRGSGGYGIAYAEAGYGHWGDTMQDDITDGVEALIKSGQADPNRICIFGGSYGGYSALIAGAQHPELYKCVVSWAGISDLTEMMKTERGGLFVGERSPAYDYDVKAIGDLDKDKDHLAKTSAVTFAAQYVPPVLLIHGTQDSRVPIAQSREMNQALKAAHKDVRLIEVKAEDHTDWAPEHEEAALTQVADFIAAHIAPAHLSPPPPPAVDQTAAPNPPAAPAKDAKPSASDAGAKP